MRDGSGVVRYRTGVNMQLSASRSVLPVGESFREWSQAAIVRSLSGGSEDGMQ